MMIGIVVLALLQILDLILKFRKVTGQAEPREIKPQPLLVRADATYMTADRCSELHAASDRLIATQVQAITDRLSELASAMERRNKDGEDRAAAIHQRVNRIAETMRGQEEKLEMHLRTHKKGERS